MHKIFFQYNIPADNESVGRTNSFIDVVVTWNGKDYFHDGRPMIHVEGCNFSFYDALKVNDWFKAHSDIEKIANEKFAEIARQEKINKAKETLVKEGEPSGNPIMDYYTQHHALS